MRQHFRALLAGPNALPPKRRLWGLLRNRDYNRAVKKSSHPYAQSAWKEKSVYRRAYFLNALTIFLGSQFDHTTWKVDIPTGLDCRQTLGAFFDAGHGV